MRGSTCKLLISKKDPDPLQAKARRQSTVLYWLVWALSDEKIGNFADLEYSVTNGAANYWKTSDPAEDAQVSPSPHVSLENCPHE